MSCGGCCPDRPIVTDEVCLNWEFNCDGTDRTIWEADGNVIKPFGTVTVLVENSCDGVEVRVNDTLIATLKEGQSFSKTFHSLKKVAIKCKTALKTTETPVTSTGICCGKLCMTVHYKKC
ncbi:DUF3992 domain-containing protein [Anoxybacillus flavithermus]|nr:S-Ena type endospore appendage [Anoxybacillus flavithermus]